MTDRYFAITVLLEENIREDDAQPIIEAIKMIKGVIKVKPHIADVIQCTAEHRAKLELRHLKKKRSIPQSLIIELQEAIERPQAVIELDRVNDIYERYIVIGNATAKINNQAVYDLLRGIVTAICLTMTEDEASELIEQINAQEIVNQYGHKVEYGRVIRKRE